MERTPRLHVAILDEELPFPLTSGKRIRTYHLLSRLAERQRITYLSHRNPDPDEAAAAEAAMHRLGIRTITVDRQIPLKSGLGFYARLAANLFSSLPYSVASHHSDELSKAVRRLSETDPPDLWHCEWTPYGEYFRRPFGAGFRECPVNGNTAATRRSRNPAPWVVMAHNVESLIWQRYTETEQHPLKRWYINRQFRKFERFERWAYSTCDRAIAVSNEDAALIRDRFGAKQVEVVDNGVDTAFFEPGPQKTRDPFRILFLGSLDWRPNLDGVRMLLDEIFPQVQKQEPRATLAIVGRKPATWLRETVGGRAGVDLHADVADVRPYLAKAGMLAVPLRIGGGSRLKILVALAAGLPVVTTQIGAEGLQLEAGKHVTRADSSEEFASALLETMSHPEVAATQSARGRERVLERYDWSGLADRLEAIWLEIAGVTIPLNEKQQQVTVNSCRVGEGFAQPTIR